ncbi:MAG: amidohydrolase family protein [Opitutales bacterium]|nr:amidohydrolase family protein [Opitutales bacterium]
MKIADLHTHFYPEKISRDVSGWAAEYGESHWLSLVGSRPDGRESLQSFPTISEFLKAMDDAGVERACMQSWYWQNPKAAAEANKMLAETVQKHSDRLFAYACVNPASASFEQDLRRARDMGFQGVGELHDGVQKFDYASENFGRFCEICAEYSFAVCLHLTDPGGRPYPNKIATNNSAAFEAARANQRVKFLFAHFGGGEVFKEGFIPPANAFFDCAANTFLYGAEGFSRIGKSVLEKMRFGSDYSLRLYPKKFKTAEMKTFAEECASAVPEEFRESFFCGAMQTKSREVFYS